MPWLMYHKGVLDPRPIMPRGLHDAQTLALRHYGIELEWASHTPDACTAPPLTIEDLEPEIQLERKAPSAVDVLGTDGSRRATVFRPSEIGAWAAARAMAKPWADMVGGSLVEDRAGRSVRIVIGEPNAHPA